jgi:hypothetical protein
MKKLLPIIFFFPVLLFAQEKSPGFFKKYHYFKVSPSVLLLTEMSDELSLTKNAVKPALFGTIGGKISRYTAVGFCTGIFALNAEESNNTVIPFGVDLTITDFKAKKAFPVIFGQWFRASFKEQYSLGRGGRVNYNITGKQMYNVGAGIAFRAFGTNKLSITGSYSQLFNKTVLTTKNPEEPYPTPTVTNRNGHHSFLVLSVNLIF